jgi:hypothetical protein
VTHYEFSLGPSTPDHDRALRALDRLDGFASALDEGAPISLPMIGEWRAGPEGS